MGNLPMQPRYSRGRLRRTRLETPSAANHPRSGRWEVSLARLLSRAAYRPTAAGVPAAHGRAAHATLERREAASRLTRCHAAGRLGGEMKPLPTANFDQLRDRFDADGFVIVRGLFDADEMRELHAQVERYIRE